MAKKQPRFGNTDIPAHRTANEIGEIVHKYGAKMFSVTFADKTREPASVYFLMDVPDVGEVPVSLTAQVDGIYKRLTEDRYYGYDEDRMRTQATRIAWRQIKAYVEMQLEMVQNKLRPFHEAFMADVMIHVGEGEWKRLGAAYMESKGNLRPALPPGRVVDADVEIVD
ncbi:MAG TPA: hypothetical protein VEY33_09590 [Gemmatimonadota bacterium]|nr:hypothetical protein [Gemmatimonadota bacterium]